jgi:hypothetical protein
MTDFAAYARISTRDKQDPSLSFPSQFEAGRKRIAELGGSVVASSPTNRRAPMTTGPAGRS